MKGTITIKDVAKKAGVSISTVSRVINNSKPVTDEVKQKVLDVIKETGYIPVRESAINSDEYKNSGSLIAPIISDSTKNLFTNPLVKGMDSAFRESSTVLESILAEKNPDVKAKLESFKSTLMSIWE